MVAFVTQNGPIFRNIRSHKSETMWLKVSMGGEHHKYYKHKKFHQNPRGDPKFLVDLTQNDPNHNMSWFSSWVAGARVYPNPYPRKHSNSQG